MDIESGIEKLLSVGAKVVQNEGKLESIMEGLGEGSPPGHIRDALAFVAALDAIAQAKWLKEIKSKTGVPTGALRTELQKLSGVIGSKANHKPEEVSPADIDADPCRPPDEVVKDAVDVYKARFGTIKVNNALRTTHNGLSSPCNRFSDSVFLGPYQTLRFHAPGKTGRNYSGRPGLAAAVYEEVIAQADATRVGRAAWIGGRWVDTPGLHKGVQYYCTETHQATGDYSNPKEAVLSLWEGVYRDFPFTDPDCLHRVLAAILTPFLMTVIKGPIPCFLHNAPNRGDGKTLLAQTFGLIADGDECLLPWGTDDKFQENLLSALDSDKRYLIIDNVKGEVGGSLLEAIITSRKVLGNVKYGNTREFSVDKVIIITGVNVILTPDMARRVVRIVVDRKGKEQPENMEALERYIEENRPTLLGCVRAMLQAWDGRVLPVKGHKTFEQWAGTMAGIFSSCGLLQEELSLINPEAVAEQHDADVMRWGDLLDAWWGRWGDTRMTANEIAMTVGIGAVRYATGCRSDEVRNLGAALAGMDGRLIAGYRIVRARIKVATQDSENEKNVYSLERQD